MFLKHFWNEKFAYIPCVSLRKRFVDWVSRGISWFAFYFKTSRASLLCWDVTQWNFQNIGKSGWTGTSSFVLVHCVTCVPAWLIKYHVTASSKDLLKQKQCPVLVTGYVWSFLEFPSSFLVQSRRSSQATADHNVHDWSDDHSVTSELDKLDMANVDFTPPSSQAEKSKKTSFHSCNKDTYSSKSTQGNALKLGSKKSSGRTDQSKSSKSRHQREEPPGSEFEITRVVFRSSEPDYFADMEPAVSFKAKDSKGSVIQSHPGTLSSKLAMVQDSSQVWWTSCLPTFVVKTQPRFQDYSNEVGQNEAKQKMSGSYRFPTADWQGCSLFVSLFVCVFCYICNEVVWFFIWVTKGSFSFFRLCVCQAIN